jgi:hypothetical protein
MKKKLSFPILIFWFFPLIYCITINETTERSVDADACIKDSAHFWKLKPNLDPQIEDNRIIPGNYKDMGIVDPPSGNDPCNSGYVELCGIYVIPDPANKSQPYFSRSVNADIYQALEKNQYLEGKVFYKDL